MDGHKALAAVVMAGDGGRGFDHFIRDAVDTI